MHHYAFLTSSEQTKSSRRHLPRACKEAGLKYGSAPWTPEDMQVGNQQSLSSSPAGYTEGATGGRIVYFREVNGHLLEIRTRA